MVIEYWENLQREPTAYPAVRLRPTHARRNACRPADARLGYW